MEVQILESEYWWGGIVDIGMDMPWDRSSVCTIDPSTMGRDQRSPLFISSFGRCIWSEKPFVMKFNKGVIEIDSQVHFETGGKNLKGAHAIAADRLFPKKGIPDKRFSMCPSTIPGLN